MKRDPGKSSENLDIELLSLKDAGIDADIVEDGKTFEENAQIKVKDNL